MKTDTALQFTLREIITNASGELSRTDTFGARTDTPDTDAQIAAVLEVFEQAFDSFHRSEWSYSKGVEPTPYDEGAHDFYNSFVEWLDRQG